MPSIAEGRAWYALSMIVGLVAPRGRAPAAFAGLLLAVAACTPATVSGPRRDGSVSVDAAGPVDGAAAEADATSADGPRPPADASPPLPCDPRFELPPPPLDASEALTVRFRDTTPWANVELTAAGPGAPQAAFGGVTSAGTPKTWTWTYTVSGHAAGVLELTFTRDHGEAVASCQARVVGTSVDAGSTCTPSCAGVICGGDDGCGTPCSGGHRDQHGAVADCRLAGDCGCGQENNDNMQCTSGGQCRVRCSCDCLPPQDVSPQTVQGLDRAGACRVVFQNSGDPTVWNAAAGQPLCPVDHDPVGAARCTECPPCHRDHPPACSWEAWCTCSDARWVSDYQSQCCAAGAQYCY